MILSAKTTRGKNKKKNAEAHEEEETVAEEKEVVVEDDNYTFRQGLARGLARGPTSDTVDDGSDETSVRHKCSTGIQSFGISSYGGDLLWI